MIESFLEMLITTRGASKNTLENYRRDLENLESFTKKSAEKSTEKNLENYFADLEKRGMSARTHARHLATFQHFFLFLKQEGIRKDIPTQSLFSPKIGKSLPKALSEKEIETLLNSCKNTPKGIRLRTMIELLYASGLRVSELLSLKMTSLLRENTSLHIQGKGKKERIVPLHPIAKDALEKYLKLCNKKSTFLFPSPKTGNPITRDGFFKMLKKHALNVGVNPTRVSPHAFRHSFASHLLKGGANLRAVQELLGHEDISTTEIYTHILDDELKSEVFSKHPLSKKIK